MKTAQRKQLVSKYEKLRQKIAKAFHHADPYGLIEGGSPKDEFNSEITKITGLLYKEKFKNPDRAKQIIMRVLQESFGEVALSEDELERFAEDICKD